jgi:phosphopantetheine adenylyltransferase
LDLEKTRQNIIKKARLVMDYHIECTDEQFQAEIASLEEEYMVRNFRVTNISSPEVFNNLFQRLKSKA